MSKKPQLRRSRKMNVERLENRSLMAGDVAVRLDGNTLLIQGDGADNQVAISRDPFHNNDTIFVSGNFTTRNGSDEWLKYSLRDVRNIRVNMGGGNDTFTLDGNVNLESVDVVMGRGVEDLVKISSSNRLEKVAVDARETNYARVTIGGNVGTLNVQSGPRRDEVFLMGSIDNATVKTGLGNDDLTLDNAQIGRLRAEMGRGRDRLFMYSASVDSGVINFGAGVDTTVRGLRRISRNYEKVT